MALDTALGSGLGEREASLWSTLNSRSPPSFVERLPWRSVLHLFLLPSLPSEERSALFYSRFFTFGRTFDPKTWKLKHINCCLCRFFFIPRSLFSIHQHFNSPRGFWTTEKNRSILYSKYVAYSRICNLFGILPGETLNVQVVQQNFMDSACQRGFM